jgi:hypothetical protein
MNGAGYPIRIFGQDGLTVRFEEYCSEEGIA